MAKDGSAGEPLDMSNDIKLEAGGGMPMLSGRWYMRKSSTARTATATNREENDRIVSLHREEMRQQHRSEKERGEEIERAVEAAVRRRWPDGIPNKVGGAR